MNNKKSRGVSSGDRTRLRNTLGPGVITLAALVLAALTFTPRSASAQVFSIPIRWCVVANDANGNGRVDPGEAGAPAFTNPGNVGEPDTDNVLWRRHERPSDSVYIPEAQITFRSGIYNIVEDPILRFPIIPDPDPITTGGWLYGDILMSSADSILPSVEWNAAHNACVQAWRDQHGVEDIGVVVINANHSRNASVDSEPGVAVLGGRRILLRDNAYLLPGSPLYNSAEFPVADHVDKHFGHEMGHALASLRHTCNNQNLMSNRRLDPSGDARVDNIHLSTSIAQVIDPGGDDRDCGTGNNVVINPGPDDTTQTVNQIQLLRDAARATPGCKIAGTNTDCTRRSDVRTDRIRDSEFLFTDLSLVTATDEGAFTKLFHEPMGPLNRRYFGHEVYFDYFTFLDQDRDAATGGSAEDLGVEVRFKGAELVTRVRVRVGRQGFEFAPTVWRFERGSFRRVRDRRIRAYAFPLIALSERRTDRLTDQITIEMPNVVFGPGITDFRVQAAVIRHSPAGVKVLDLLDEDKERPGVDFRWRSPRFPVCSVNPGAAPRGGSITVKSTGLMPNRPVHLIFGDRHVANGHADAAGTVVINTAVPAYARDGQHLITVGTDQTALTADCVTTVKGGPRPPQDGYQQRPPDAYQQRPPRRRVNRRRRGD